MPIVQVKLDHDDDDGDSEFEISDEEDEEEEVKKTLSSIRIADPGLAAFLDHWIRDRFFFLQIPDPNPYFSELSVTIFLGAKKYYNSLSCAFLSP